MMPLSHDHQGSFMLMLDLFVANLYVLVSLQRMQQKSTRQRELELISFIRLNEANKIAISGVRKLTHS